MTSQDGQYQALVKQGSDLIWEAASLHPGTPGHASRTALIVERMRALFRTATAEISRLTAELDVRESAAATGTVAPEPEVTDHA